jgi:DNA-binding NarL/FixJ family response regulator
MDYLTKSHYTMRNKPFLELQGQKVLLAEPEAESRSFYTRQLADIDMIVVGCDRLDSLMTATASAQPDVVIVNPGADLDAAMATLRALRRQFPSLPIITMAMTMPDSALDAMMEIGVSLHINRSLTRPRDLLLALEQVLK